MSKLETTKRYLLILEKLRAAKRASWKEIAEHLELKSEIDGLNYNISFRTFQRDVEEIASLFGVYIEYSYSGKCYFIEEEFEPEVSDRVFEAFDVYNTLNVKKQQSQYVHFEKRRSKGTEHFYGMLHAIRNRLLISFSYHKFYKNHPENRTVEPMILKEFRHRWYLLARDTYDSQIKFYALDRLSELKVQETHYKEDAGFDIDEYLEHCFGVIVPDDETPCGIVLSLDPFQGKYIKSLPIHSSQKIIADSDEELRISLKLCITHDFKMELLSYGDTVKVLEPQSLAAELKEIYKKALEKYL
jgi:predicted DNA-binding transcriptional regulator YafY